MPTSNDRFSAAELRSRTIVRESIGQAIKARREAIDRTQLAVASDANISARELRRIENGIGGMQLDRLWPIARALDCDPSDIVQAAERIEAEVTKNDQ